MEMRLEGVMAKAKGLMIAAMEPQATEEEEFNDWYDLELIRFVGAGANGACDIIDGLRRQFESRPEVRQLRVFRDDENAGREFLGVLELAAPLGSLTVDMGQMGPDCGTIRMMNLYTPYLRRRV